MTLSDRSAWRTRRIRRPGRPLVNWLRLGTLGNPEITVGVLKDGSWVVDTADGLADLEDDKALILAFPILNSSIHEIHDRLLEFQRIPENSIRQEFPLSRLVVHAISCGGYWAEQSLPWLSELKLDDLGNEAAIDGLMVIENNKEFSQVLRQKARRLRRQMEQSSR